MVRHTGCEALFLQGEIITQGRSYATLQTLVMWPSRQERPMGQSSKQLITTMRRMCSYSPYVNSHSVNSSSLDLWRCVLRQSRSRGLFDKITPWRMRISIFSLILGQQDKRRVENDVGRWWHSNKKRQIWLSHLLQYTMKWTGRKAVIHHIYAK